MTSGSPGTSAAGPAETAAQQAWLTAHGRRPWAQASALLTGCTCAWADLDGFHAGSPPAEPPLATHLWAWGPGRLLRMRIDGTDTITAELHLSDPCHGEPVTITQREASTWPLREQRVSISDQWRDRNISRYQVTGLMPLEFVRLHDTAPASGNTDEA